MPGFGGHIAKEKAGTVTAELLCGFTKRKKGKGKQRCFSF